MLAEKIEIETDRKTNHTGGGQMAIQEISLNKIKLNKNSRLTIKSGDLADLMASIKEVGLLQPIGLVDRNGHYEVCYGNRRFLAYSKLGKSKIPAVIHEAGKPQDAEIKNLVENIQRRNIGLIETGRWIVALQKDGLSLKEIAVRLSVSSGYVASCLDSYNEVPKQFQDDLEVGMQGRRPAAGKISVTTARAILNAKKAVGLDSESTKKLFAAAKGDDRFIAQNAMKYATAIKRGRKNFMAGAQELKVIRMNFFITAGEHSRLTKKHVEDGHYNALSSLFKDILGGKKSETVKIEVVGY